MDNFVDFVANHVIMNITTIRESAARFGGQCSWHFSQCKDPVRTIIGKAGKTDNGICEILSAKWVALTVSGLGTLQGWLSNGGAGKRKDLDVARISILAQAFGSGYDDQENTTEAWLKAQNVSQLNQTDMGGGIGHGASKVDIDDLLGDMSGRVGRLGNPVTGLISIAEDNYWLKYKGHAMAIRLHSGATPPVMYFDPNYGEFTFPNYNSFKDWFTFYYRESHYQKFLGTYYKVRYFN